MTSVSADTRLPEGGWGWMAVLAVSIHTFFKGGIRKAFTLVFEEMRERYDSSAQATAWVYALHEMACFVPAPLSSMLVARYSCRSVGITAGLVFSASIIGVAYSSHLILTCVLFGLFAGTSLGTLSIVKFVNLREWWDQKLGRVSSIGLAPSGIGSMIFSALLPFSFSYYGYTGTMLILGGLASHSVLVGVLSRPPDWYDFVDEKRGRCDVEEMNHLQSITTETPSDAPRGDSCRIPSKTEMFFVNNIQQTDDSMNGKTEKDAFEPIEKSITGEYSDKQTSTCCEKFRGYFDYRLLADIKCLSLSLLMCCISLTLALTDTHFAGFAKEKGLSITQISTILVITGALSIPTRLVSGFFFDLKMIRPRRAYVYGVWFLILGTILVVLPLVEGLVVLYALWIVYSLLDALLNVMNTVVLASVISKESYRSAIGVQRFFRGLGVAIGPPLGGYLKDIYGIYDYTFYLGGGIALVSGLFFLGTITVKDKLMKE